VLSKIVQLEAKVPQQETLMVALNHILKLKEVVGEKMNQLGQKDTQLEEKMIELDQRDSQLENKLNELQSVRESILKRVLELETATEESPIQTDSLEFLNRSSRKSSNPRTCREIHSSDPSLPSGMYWIDPDGQGVGDDAIYVHCDMATGIPIIVQYFAIIISDLKFKIQERLRFFTIASHLQTLAIALNPDVIRGQSTTTQQVNKFQLWLNCHKNVINLL
jgi:hypothetical protein